ncbi:7893_t:CDS:2 [Rhizophagus irregularis]|nr:7893_t:CDS:2 [Rhizophagus irregularis]
MSTLGHKFKKMVSFFIQRVDNSCEMCSGADWQNCDYSSSKALRVMAHTWLSRIILKITLPYMAGHGQGWSKTAVIFKEVNLKQPRLMKPVSNRSLAESKINRVDHIANLPDKRDSNTLENLQSKKPNFKLLINTNDKILFGVVKSPKYKNSSLLACQNLIKLVNFQSKEIVSFWDSILEREKRHATEEHDYKTLEQVRSKHVSIGGADVARAQRENAHSEELAFILYKRAGHGGLPLRAERSPSG